MSALAVFRTGVAVAAFDVHRAGWGADASVSAGAMVALAAVGRGLADMGAG